MNSLITFPERSRVNKIIHKKTIYDKTNPTQKIKDQFSKEVEKIIWEYKLSSDTLNIPSDKSIKEFQIFSIYQRNETFPEFLIKFIDKAIPSPIIFILKHNNSVKYAVSVNSSPYFYSKQILETKEKISLPVVLDIESLYHELTKMIINPPVKENLSIEETLEVAELIKQKQKELQQLQTKLDSEKQFNRKVELHNQIKRLITELENING